MDNPKANENNLKVIARFRPLISIELELADKKELELKFEDETTVRVPRMPDDYESFSFDRVFSPNATQEEIFEFVGKPIIEDVLTGYNGTVFAYGQTGSGKTYTMMGLNAQDPLTRGIIPNSANLIFQTLATSSSEIAFTVKCSMLEIYKETLKDLLGNSGELKIKQEKRKGVFVQGLTEVYVVCEEEMLEVLSLGESNRTVASTKMNTASSRSHQLLMVEIAQKLPNDSEKRGILNLVDLAGSEKINQTGVTGVKLEEAKKINLSLSALGNVIKALTDKAEHIPYRDSKLTRLLQESLGGNYKTTLIVNCSPHPRNLDDSLNTLKFAQRAKTIKNKAYVNVKRSPEAYMRIIDELKRELALTMAELENYRSKKSTHIDMVCEEKVDALVLSDEIILEAKFSDDRFENAGNIEEMRQTLSSLKQDQEHYCNKIKELETELDHERRHRMKVEKENFDQISKNQSPMACITENESPNNFYIEENESLKKQISLLKFHLRVLSDKYGHNLAKVKNGEMITEWEFTDMTQFPSDRNAKLPVYTEENSLEVVNTSEFHIDIPINESILLKNDKYSQRLCEKLVDSANVNKEVLIFQLKKQFIQSGIINCELSRSYYEILWKYKLLREKMNLRSKVIKTQKERIDTLEKANLSMQGSFMKIVEILEKMENAKLNGDANSDFSKGKMIRFVRNNAQTEPKIIKQRKNNRMVTDLPFKTPLAIKRNSLLDISRQNKQMFLESNLQIQTLFNHQLKKANEIMVFEKNSYKHLIEDLSKENVNVYSKEKLRWKEFLDNFKEICEQELVRKQIEINRLNELLGRWIHKYMELEEVVSKNHKKARVLDETHKRQIEELLISTKMHVRPPKLNIQESPMHCKFKGSISMHISHTSGDISPPEFE